MKLKIKKTVKKAFTLAEILVTLAVLGVVFAALAPTVNTFNQERSEKEYKAKTGKAYSVLSEALRARFIADKQRMVGNSAASNLVKYLTSTTDGNGNKISGIVKTTKIKGDSAFKTQEGMVFAVSGSNCHEGACYVIVDLDGQKRGKTKDDSADVANLISNFSTYRDATANSAKENHSDIVVFMVKDGQVFPHSRYTAENMQMQRTTSTALSTDKIDIQFSELNIGTD